MAAATSAIDDYIREYLLFRGFTSTLKAFEAEVKSDKDKSFKVDRVIQQLFSHVTNHDLLSLRDFWQHLHRRFFSRLNQSLSNAVHTLETCLYRLYLVHNLQNGRVEKVTEFFEKMSPDLQNQPEWKDWFILPYIKNAEQHPIFEAYFTKSWCDTFTVSLYNFLSVIFQHMPLPALLNFEAEKQKIRELEVEKRSLQNEVRALTTAATAQKMSKMKLPIKPAVKEIRKKTEGSGGTDSAERGGDRSNKGKATATATATAPKVTKPSPEKTDWKLAAPPIDLPPPYSASTAIVESPIALMSLKPTGAGAMLADSDDDQPFLVLGQDFYEEHCGHVTHCCFSSTGSLIASADTEGIVKIWSFAPIQTKATVTTSAEVLSLNWANRIDRMLFIGTGNGLIRLFDIESKRIYCEIESEPQYPRIVSLTSSPNGQYLIYGCASKYPSPPPPSSPPSAQNPISPGKSIRTKLLSKSDYFGALVCWDIKAMKEERNLTLDPGPTAINCASFNHNGNLLVTGAADGMIRLYDMTQWDVLMGWQGHIGEVYAVEFSCDETTVFSAGEDGKFLQWSLHHIGQRIADLSLPLEATNPLQAAGYTGTDTIPRGRLFAFDSEGQYFITCGPSNGLVYKLEDASLEVAMSLGGHSQPVVAVDWSTATHCGACLTGSLDGTVRVTTLLKQ
ncbi:WD repeat-containing protein 91-like isoform X2 [Oscarella lobularis]|uniref:WD repeat-containing protein 91-like isoform X2 n=1 Tax=Oscarella lobularis TaxID=121494 RepID=UPI003313CE96